MKVNRLLLALSTVLLPAHFSFAQDSECVKGEYVMSVATDALKPKAEKALEAVSSEELTIVDEAPTSETFLLQTESELRDADSGLPEIVEFNKKSDLCEKMERKRRADILKEKEAGKVSVATLRRYDCSCNGVIYAADPTPNDPSFSNLWGLHQANDIDINAPDAWTYYMGSPSTVVAVIDSGVDYNHPDLRDNMWVNPNEIAGNGIDDDHNGYVDDVHGVNTINNTGDPMDDNKHGTHCAGTIAARGHNNIGVVGVNWYSNIIAVKFLNSSGSGSLYDAVKAIDYVTNLKVAGVPVALSSNSWGGGGYYQTLLDAIRRARDRGILFVAAAGNASSNNDSVAAYPANYDSDNIISVAAIDSNGNLASFSNYGATTVDIAAPGVNILSTTPNNGYMWLSGTSMATPHVSGALALLISYRPQLTYLQYKNLIYEYAIPQSNLVGKVATGKRLSLRNLLVNSPGGTPLPTATPTIVPTAAPTFTPTIAPTATPTVTPTATATPGWYNIQGRVRTAQGTGISGAKVVLSGEGGEFTVYSGPNGEYSFSSILGPKSYTLKTTLSGHSFQQRFVYLTTSVSIDIEGYANEFVLSGKVITNNKSPVSGVMITLNDDESSAVYTNSQGQFTFAVPMGMEYTLNASHPGYHLNLSELTGVILGDVARTFVAKEK